MKDSQQESHTEATPEETVKTLDYFYNEQGDYTITLNDQPLAYIPKEDIAKDFCKTFNGLMTTVEKQTKAYHELYAKLQKIKALTQDIR